ncbi:hypothetical protein Tsubulata_047065 [Turnera subulata]|uniref:F-box domain-containing protein n=1 Tax=Turnera subulata TaxID=218843 RepID=A0A9Q0J213_9ROSI|nr:hypothetical protein Tsubulata_047065 [Turnera subulata]
MERSTEINKQLGFINPTTDYFGKLPDEIVLIVLSKVHDPKTLIRCSCLCKRFSSFASKTHTIALKIHRKETNNITEQDPLIDLAESTICSLDKTLPNLQNIAILLRMCSPTVEIARIRGVLDPKSTAFFGDSCCAIEVGKALDTFFAFLGEQTHGVFTMSIDTVDHVMCTSSGRIVYVINIRASKYFQSIAARFGWQQWTFAGVCEDTVVHVLKVYLALCM